MNVLVTGASGLLGSEILSVSKDFEFKCSALDRIAFLNAKHEDQSAMLDNFDIIIHAAANTDLEQCENNEEMCFFDNCFLTEQLFRHAEHHRTKFVFISSTGVYGRHKTTPYNEYDYAFPTTAHHRSKLAAENIILRNVNSLVIRTGWLFGGALNHKKNFVAQRVKELRLAKESIYSNITQVGSPTYSRDCAQRIIELIVDQCSGVYNVVNDGVASRFDYVKRIAEFSGANVDVIPTASNIFNRLADVSENEAAVSYRMKFENRAPMRMWHDALQSYMSDLIFLG